VNKVCKIDKQENEKYVLSDLL